MLSSSFGSGVAADRGAMAKVRTVLEVVADEEADGKTPRTVDAFPILMEEETTLLDNIVDRAVV